MADLLHKLAVWAATRGNPLQRCWHYGCEGETWLPRNEIPEHNREHMGGIER